MLELGHDSGGIPETIALKLPWVLPRNWTPAFAAARQYKPAPPARASPRAGALQ